MYVEVPRRAPRRPARGSSTAAASTRSPTTSAPTSRSQQLPEGVPITVEGCVRAVAADLRRHVRLGAERLRAARKQTVDAAAAPPQGRAAPGGPQGRLGQARRSGATRRWACGSRRCRRSTSSSSERSAAALDRYGPDFKYGHNYAAKRLPTVIAGTAGVASVFVLAQIPPARKGLMKLHPAGHRTERREARQELVPRRVRRRGRRQDRVAPRSPAASRATTRPRRCSPRARWPGLRRRRPSDRTADAGRGDGRRAARAPAQGRHQDRSARRLADASTDDFAESRSVMRFATASGVKPTSSCSSAGAPCVT